MILGSATIYIVGLIWLARFVGSENVLTLGLYPFAPGAIIKIALAAMILPTAWKLLKKLQ
ncbi:MAG: biotin transporter BioY [Candidatus Zixiibacteriota bacterium]